MFEGSLMISWVWGFFCDRKSIQLAGTVCTSGEEEERIKKLGMDEVGGVAMCQRDWGIDLRSQAGRPRASSFPGNSGGTDLEWTCTSCVTSLSPSFLSAQFGSGTNPQEPSQFCIDLFYATVVLQY